MAFNDPPIPSSPRRIFELLLIGYFLLRWILISFCVSIIWFLIFLVNTSSNMTLIELLQEYMIVLGLSCAGIGILIILFFGCTSHQARVTTTFLAGRYLTPNLNQFSREFINRQLTDFHRLVGATIMVLGGFFIALLSYVLF